MASALLEVRGLRVDFPGAEEPRVAVDDVWLDVEPGEMVGVVGESGAGKSVTGAAVIGLIDPPGRIVGGEVWFDGRRIDRLSQHDLRRLRGRHIGSVFQDPLASLNPLFTVERQLVETIRTHLPMSRGEARRRAVELLEAAGVPQAPLRVGQFPHQLSGGLRQRVVIALALAAEPRLIVADEPTTALDVSTQARVLATLQRLCRDRGVAVMLITHDLAVIAGTCDRVVVMYAGRVVETGPVADLLDEPLHPYTRGLIDAIPSIDVTRDRLAQIDGAMPRPDSVPGGCAFHPRCPSRLLRCKVEVPPSFGAGQRRVACWLHEAPVPETE